MPVFREDSVLIMDLAVKFNGVKEAANGRQLSK